MNAPDPAAISARTSTVAGADGALAVYEAKGAEPTAGLVIVHEAFGVTDHIADVVRRAAAEGYHAVAPDLFHRGGGGVAPYGDLMAAKAYFEGMAGDDGILADMDAAMPPREPSRMASEAAQGARTVADQLGKGVGARILERILATARARGYKRLSLETGSTPAFDAAHALYRKFGFDYCGAFGDYPAGDPFSRFMTRAL